MFGVVAAARKRGRSLTSTRREPEMLNVLEYFRQFHTIRVILHKTPIAPTPETLGVRLEVSK